MILYTVLLLAALGLLWWYLATLQRDLLQLQIRVAWLESDIFLIRRALQRLTGHDPASLSSPGEGRTEEDPRPPADPADWWKNDNRPTL